jgi:molybdopterin-guanine dinucleotide biosynthesis protein A
MPPEFDAGPLPAIILSGGRSRRMGTDKARLPWSGATIYSRIEDVLAEFATHLVVVAGFHGSPPDSARERIVVRDEAPDMGPMEGVRVGLRACRELGAPIAVVTTGDAPLIVPELFRFMIGQLREDPLLEAVAPRVNGVWYPLTAAYRTGVVEEVQRRIDAGLLRARDLVASLRVRELSAETIQRLDPALQSLRNINTLDEYRQLQDELKARQS